MMIKKVKSGYDLMGLCIKPWREWGRRGKEFF
jgi:hypothetical protein